MTTLQAATVCAPSIRASSPKNRDRPTYGPDGRFFDEYDRAVHILSRRPDLIGLAWQYGGCTYEVPSQMVKQDGVSPRQTALAAFCTPLFKSPPCEAGCLTMLRSGLTVPPRTALGKVISRDERLPTCRKDITPDNLPAFAAWQRRIDREPRT